jgi:hypothetical protein
MSDKPSFAHRSLVFLFSVGIVLISGTILRIESQKKQKKQQVATEESSAKFLQELRGEVDVGKASISTEYLKEVVDTSLLRPEDENKNKTEIRRNLKERAFNLFHRVMPQPEAKQ